MLRVSRVSRVVRRASGGTLVGGLESFGEIAARRPFVATAVVLSGSLLLGRGPGDVWCWVVGLCFAVGLGVRSVLQRGDSRPESADRGRRGLDVRDVDVPGVVPGHFEDLNR
jgi:hypothetical protein